MTPNERVLGVAMLKAHGPLHLPKRPKATATVPKKDGLRAGS